MCEIFRLAAALIFAAAPALPGRAESAAASDPRFAQVTVDPMKTSIYIGRVRLITGVFERDGDRFTTGYEAKVFPFFFYNETGRIAITLPEAELRRIANGEVRPFSGEAVNHRGKKRRIEGRAEPADADQGRIKIRVFVDGIELIFNGAYRFTGDRVIQNVNHWLTFPGGASVPDPAKAVVSTGPPSHDRLSDLCRHV